MDMEGGSPNPSDAPAMQRPSYAKEDRAVLAQRLEERQFVGRSCVAARDWIASPSCQVHDPLVQHKFRMLPRSPYLSRAEAFQTSVP